MARIDLPGALLFMTSITSLMFALNGGGVEYAWSEPQSWTPILGFVISMGLFIVYQIRLGDESVSPTQKRKEVSSVANRSQSFYPLSHCMSAYCALLLLIQPIGPYRL